MRKLLRRALAIMIEKPPIKAIQLDLVGSVDRHERLGRAAKQAGRHSLADPMSHHNTVQGKHAPSAMTTSLTYLNGRGAAVSRSGDAHVRVLLHLCHRRQLAVDRGGITDEQCKSCTTIAQRLSFVISAGYSTDRRIKLQRPGALRTVMHAKA